MQQSLSTAVAIYGAILSTLVFAWKLFEFAHDRSTRLKVKLGKRLASKSEKSLELNLFLTCFVTNVGRIDTKIFKPSLVTDTNVSDAWNLEWRLLGDQRDWPKELKVNDIVKRDFPIHFIDSEINERRVNRFRFQVKTTKGKIFYSEWISFSDLFHSDEAMDFSEIHPQ